MRLPTDATLLVSAGLDPALAQVWREEGLPVAHVASEAEMDALATATVVACDRATAAKAAALGFRTFLVGAPPAPEGARCVPLSETLDAARAARARERWKAARAAGRA